MSQTPVTLAKDPPPNVLFIFDNSSSMGLTDNFSLSQTIDAEKKKRKDYLSSRSYYSVSFNKLYYNPDVTYLPALDTNNSSMQHASKQNVKVDPFHLYMINTGSPNSVPSWKIDLTTRCDRTNNTIHPLPTYAKEGDYDTTSLWSNPFSNCQVNSINPQTGQYAYYAFYYRWQGQGQGQPDGSSAQDTDTYYKRVDILPKTTTYPKSATHKRTDCAHQNHCTYDEEIQNFANWFAYYRSRLNTAKTVIGHVINDFENKINLGLTSINNNNNANNTTAWGFVPIQPLSPQHKKTWLEKLYGNSMQGGTALREAFYRGGQYFKTGIMEGESNTPNPVQYTCQRNAIILATDGAWNDNVSLPNIGNQDATIPSLPAPINQNPISGTPLTRWNPFPRPFLDIHNSPNTLADIAMHFWSKKLRPNSSLTMTPTDRDPAPWQHVSTYALGMAIDGTLKYQPDYETAPTGDYRDLLNGTKNWPKPEPDKPSSVDDLWHAAINGHGKYFSVKSPEELKHAMKDILTDITSQASAGARIAHGHIPGQNHSYVASYHTKHWTGQLKAFQIINHKIDTQPLWDAANTIPTHDKRNIFTKNRNTFVAFQWNKLSSNTQQMLRSKELVNYLRGDKTHEGSTGPHRFRKRESPLGDIVNSLPFYTHATDFHYNKLPTNQGGSDYLAFLQHKKNRHPLLFVGANDGMIHIFDAQTGEEKMAYIPQAVHDDLLELTKPNYSHQFYVDGPIVDGDVWSQNKWQNIVVVANGAGKPGLSAFDATNPSNFNKNMILWEVNKNTSGFAHLGHIVGEPTIGKLPSGDWAVVTGNGYFGNESALYLINTKDGTLIKKINVPKGDTGLSAPAVIYNAQQEIIAAYAGDLNGNLWKFDLSSSNSSHWTVSQLFSTGTGQDQLPIVQKPAVIHHTNGGHMILFGTGKLFEKNDDNDTKSQTLYGVWDKPAHTQTITPQDLQEHTLIEKTTGRVMQSTTAPNWTHHLGWKIPLPDNGERVIGNLLQINQRSIIVKTVAPKTAFCTSNPSGSWLLAIDPITGLEPKKFYFVNGTTPLFEDSKKISGLKLTGATSGITRIPSPDNDCLALNHLDGTTSCTPFREPKEVLRRWRMIPNTIH